MGYFVPLGMSRLTIQTLHSLDGLEAEGTGLDADARLPFLTFDWMASWWAHLRETRFGVRDELFALAVRRDERLIAIAPLMITHRPGRGPLRYRQLQFLGADPNITELRGLLAHPRDASEVHRAVLHHLLSRSREWDHLVYSGVEPEHVDDLSHVVPHATVSAEVASHHLDLPKTWAELRASLPRNVKESLRKCYNSLARDGLQHELQIVTQASEVESSLADFFRLHAARAEALTDVTHRNVFETPASRSFLREACTRLARRGRLRIFALRVAGSLVAMRIGFVSADELYLYYSGYDLRFAKYSVMTTTVAEAIKYAIAEGFRSVNLSFGADVSKTRWRPREKRYAELRIASPSLRGHLVRVADGRVRRTIEEGGAGIEGLRWLFGRQT